MKKILFITAFVPGQQGAGENFSRMLIDDLSKNNLVDLVYSKYSDDLFYNPTNANITVRKVFRNSTIIKIVNYALFPFLFPLFSVRFNVFRLGVIKKILKSNKYDLLFLDFSQTFIYSLFLKKIPVVMYSHDIISQRYSRSFYSFLVPFVRFSENIVLKGSKSKIFVPSVKDRDLVSKHYKLETEVTDVYLDQSILNAIPREKGEYFVFFANWKRDDNWKGLKWFIDNVLPGLNSSTSFKIIGTGMPDDLFNNFKSLADAEYMGFVDDPYPIIANAKALISPLFSGAGVKVKVVESLACGLPVIGTPISFEGLSEEFSDSMLVAETAEHFREIISGLHSKLEEKILLKEKFLLSYTNHAISSFIDSEEFYTYFKSVE